MLPVTSAARPARLLDRPAAAVARVGRADAVAGAVAGAVAARTPEASWTPRGPVRDPGAAGRRTYAESAYAAAGAARAAAGDAVEVSVRVTAGGGRLSVARRTAGGETVGIEARVA